jgi:hypothetical protein
MDGIPHDIALNPLWDLPISDPRCVNTSCFQFIYGYVKEQYAYSNDNFPRYAQWIVFFFVTLVSSFFFIYIHQRSSDYNRQTRLGQKLLARWRMLIYRRLSGRISNFLDLSYGQLLLFSLATIFVSILPFFQGYYLRGLFRFGSPPLSVRCAMLISALLPMGIALAGKVNIVTLFTGISYAKLNVWHRYLAYVIYALSIVHMVSHGQLKIFRELRSTTPNKNMIHYNVDFSIIVLTCVEDTPLYGTRKRRWTNGAGKPNPEGKEGGETEM